MQGTSSTTGSRRCSPTNVSAGSTAGTAQDVVVITVAEYERLCQVESSNPLSLGELLLEMPQNDGEFERLPVSPRDVEF